MSATMQRVRTALDKWMRDRLGFKAQSRALVIYYWLQLQEQILAVVPITICLVLTMKIYFNHTVSDPGKLSGGMIAAIFGLMMFMDGLRVAIMPLGDLIGNALPEKLKVRYILVISCALGILCTYAEPAIASLRPLADLVQRCETPYLFLVLNDYQEILVLSIGIGVGVAAMFGVLRFLRGWSLKPLIVISMVPCITCACYMAWGNPDLAPLIGLAWDCGGVTTGPVTVPILLSLGIGVMKGQRARQEAREILNEKAAANQGKSLEGFGIVTLASAFPILAVELLAIVLSFSYSREDIRSDYGRHNCSAAAEAALADPAAAAAASASAEDDATLVQGAILFALRSILPLNAFCILIIIFLLRVPLPAVSFAVPIPDYLLPDVGPALSASPDQIPGEDEDARRRRLRQDRNARMARAVDLAAQSPQGGSRRQETVKNVRPAAAAEEPVAGAEPPAGSRCGGLFKHLPLLMGIAESQVPGSYVA
jgi:hypothetical protein